MNGNCLRILEGHTGWITSLIVFEGMLISGSSDRTIKFWSYFKNKHETY